MLTMDARSGRVLPSWACTVALICSHINRTQATALVLPYCAANLSYAALQLNGDLGFSHAIYGLGSGEEGAERATSLAPAWRLNNNNNDNNNWRVHCAGLFFLGYMVLQLPSPLLCARCALDGLRWPYSDMHAGSCMRVHACCSVRTCACSHADCVVIGVQIRRACLPGDHPDRMGPCCGHVCMDAQRGAVFHASLHPGHGGERRLPRCAVADPSYSNSRLLHVFLAATRM